MVTHEAPPAESNEKSSKTLTDVCTCDRCLVENGRSVELDTDIVWRLHVLACQAMQQLRFDSAVELWTEALNQSSAPGTCAQLRSTCLRSEALHGIAGAHFEAGRTEKADFDFPKNPGNEIIPINHE